MSGVNFQAANQLISGGVEAVVADILGTPDDNGIWYDFKRNGGTIRVRNGLADHDAAFVYAKDHPANDNNAGDGPYRLEQDAVFYYHDFTVVRYALKRGEQHAVNARGTRIFILKSDDLLNGDDEADWDAASDNAEEFARIIDAAPGSIYALEAAPAPQPYGGDPQAKTSEAPELATSSVHRASPGPDRSQIEAFVLTLFKHASPGNWVSLRAFPDHGGNSKPFRITTVKLNGDFNVLIDQAYRDAELAAHYVQKVVFCPPIATFTNPNHAREADLAEGLVLSVECDAHARVARVKLEELLGPATVVVESGGEWTDPETGETEPKLHDHYRLKAPARSKDDQKKLKLARKLAARIVGGDPSNVPLVHPIRWPGSLHRKRDPKPCRIVSLNPDAEIDLDTALEILRKAVGNDDCDTTSTLRPTRSNGKSTQQLPRLEIAEAFKHLDPRQGLGQVIEPLPLLPFAPIKTECGWLRHVHDTSGADQSELLWRDALRVCMFLEQGESLIHEFSNEYKGDSKDKDYNFEATKKKFERARQDKENLDLGYPKCQTICNHGAEHCKTCPHLAKGKSPLNLALQQEGPRKPAGPYT